jgi:signal transduction histidine kinase
MTDSIIKSIFSDEIVEVALHTKAMVMMLFDKDTKQLLFANNAAFQLDDNLTVQSILQPNFDSFVMKQGESVVYHGFLTVGNVLKMTSTIEARVIKKENYILVLGDLDVPNLLEQNARLSSLNQEVNNLQRELIKEKMLLQRTKDKLEVLNTEKDHFMGVAAHDLRNPIGAASSFADLLILGRTGYSEEKIDEFLTIIKERCHYSLNLLDDLLDISRINSQSTDLKLIRTGYKELINKCVESQMPFIEQKNMNVTIQYRSEISQVLIDEMKIMQLINNLISNAVKYSHVNSDVQIIVTETDNMLNTKVVDFGLGIEEKYVENLFEPFTVTNNEATGGESSTGLGLAICKRIVESHKGQIGVESVSGKGSTFWFTLSVQEESL